MVIGEIRRRSQGGSADGSSGLERRGRGRRRTRDEAAEQRAGFGTFRLRRIRSFGVFGLRWWRRGVGPFGQRLVNQGVGFLAFQTIHVDESDDASLSAVEYIIYEELVAREWIELAKPDTGHLAFPGKGGKPVEVLGVKVVVKTALADLGVEYSDDRSVHHTTIEAAKVGEGREELKARHRRRVRGVYGSDDTARLSRGWVEDGEVLWPLPN